MPNSQETFSRFSLLKKFLREKQSDIVLFIGVILVALIGFGLGQLTAPDQQCQSLIIEDKGIGVDLSAQMLQGALPQQTNDELSSSQEGTFVASKNSDKYHWPQCPYAQKIKSTNLIWFASETQAQQAGYTRCSKFLELAPASYKP